MGGKWSLPPWDCSLRPRGLISCPPCPFYCPICCWLSPSQIDRGLMERPRSVKWLSCKYRLTWTKTLIICKLIQHSCVLSLDVLESLNHFHHWAGEASPIMRWRERREWATQLVVYDQCVCVYMCVCVCVCVCVCTKVYARGCWSVKRQPRDDLSISPTENGDCPWQNLWKWS